MLVAAKCRWSECRTDFAGDRRFDFEIRLPDEQRTAQNLAQLPIQLPNGGLIQLQDVAKVETDFRHGVRWVVKMVNAVSLSPPNVGSGRDLFIGAGVANNTETATITRRILLEYGGQFENLAWRLRMQIVIPLALRPSYFIDGSVPQL